MKPIIIDNFLEEGYFNELTNLICGTYRPGFKFAWFLSPYSILTDENDPLQYFFTHIIYEKDVPQSPFFDLVLKLYQEINGAEATANQKSLLRIRANYFPNTSPLHEYEIHIDYDFPHTAALLSLNTCDGYTGIENDDGTITKVDSVANRVVFFDGGKRHLATTTTNAKARFNLQVSYL